MPYKMERNGLMNNGPRPQEPRLQSVDTVDASLRLYIASGTQASAQALANIRHICEDYLPGRYQLDVVDILREPLRAMSDSVLFTPTLVRLSPLPQQKIVGDISEMGTVLCALRLTLKVESEPKK